MSVIKEVEKRLKHNQLHEVFLRDTLKLLKEKEDIFANEIAYCKVENTLKPCIVIGVDLPNFREVQEGIAEVKVRVQTKKGHHSVFLKDLVPFNDNSKVLFGKPKASK